MSGGVTIFSYWTITLAVSITRQEAVPANSRVRNVCSSSTVQSVESWDWCYLADSANTHRVLQAHCTNTHRVLQADSTNTQRVLHADSTKCTGNYDWLQQISWPLIGPPVIPGALGGVRLRIGGVRQVAPIPTFHKLLLTRLIVEQAAAAAAASATAADRFP